MKMTKRQWGFVSLAAGPALWQVGRALLEGGAVVAAGACTVAGCAVLVWPLVWLSRRHGRGQDVATVVVAYTGLSIVWGMLVGALGLALGGPEGVAYGEAKQVVWALTTLVHIELRVAVLFCLCRMLDGARLEAGLLASGQLRPCLVAGAAASLVTVALAAAALPEAVLALPELVLLLGVYYRFVLLPVAQEG